VKSITATEFLARIKEKPSVFEHWDTPLEITEYVSCQNSPITHLSKHLTFSGRNEVGDSANFSGCENLQIAIGTFYGFVFWNSAIKKIEDLNILQCDMFNMSATFSGCKNLKIATGRYQGFVNFEDCGIETIQNLHIQSPDEEGDYASFRDCPTLLTLKGWDLSKKILIEPEKLAAEKKRLALQKFVEKAQPQELPFL
jgi:hypothetical protein